MNKTNKELKPEIIVFAGPNGSGKSTLSELLRPVDFTYVNADDIQMALKCDVINAAKNAEEQREKLLLENKNFCFETVMSTDRNLKLLQRAKEKGYFIRCYYVLTVDPQINIFRVQSRVEEGGHDVPTEKIISRYKKSLALIKDVIKVCDICNIYDNSGDTPFRIFKKRKSEFFYQECSDWLKEDINLLTGIATSTKTNLNEI